MRHQAKATSAGSTPALATFSSLLCAKGGGGPSLRLGLAPLFALAAFLALALAPALASAAEHPSLGTFGSAAQPSFGEPAGMAVDQSVSPSPTAGDLIVIDLANQTLSRWHADGTPSNFSALAATNVIDGKTGADKVTTGAEEILSTETAGNANEAQVAIAPAGAAGGSAGDIYVTDAENGRIVVFDSTGKYLTQLNTVFPCGVAVDPAGNVYVGDYVEEKVDKFAPSVNGSPPPPTTYAKTGAFATTEPCQVAAGAQPLASGGSEGFVFATKYELNVSKLDSTTGAFQYFVSGISLNTTVSVDPATGHLYTASPDSSAPTDENEVQEYDASGASSATKVSRINLGVNGARGVAVNGATGNVYVTKEGSSTVAVYGPLHLSLAITKAGTGDGTLECEINSGGTFVPCAPTYPTGTVVKLKATPDISSEFKGYSAGSGSASSCSTSPCTFTIKADSSVTATFDLIGEHTLTITKNGTGTGTVECDSGSGFAACAATYPHGTVVELKATPTLGTSDFAGWSAVTGSGSVTTPCTGTTSPCEVKMDAAVGATATFNLAQHTLTITKNGSGTATVTCEINDGGTFGPCAATYTHGTKIKLKTTPTAGTSQFVKWTAASGSASTCNESAAPTCTFTIEANSAITATTNLIQRTLTIVKAGTGTGTVQCKVNGGSAEACAAGYPHGTSLELVATATPATSEFAGYSAGSGSALACSASCSFTITANSSVTATFNLIQRTLTIAKAGSGSGTVTCNGGACAPSYPNGTTLTLAASAASGSTFAGWSEAGCSGAGGCAVTLGADTTVTATFNANPVVLPPPPPTPPSNKITLGAAKPQGAIVLLKVTVPGPGSLVASGKNLKQAKATANGAGKLTLKLKLTSAGKKQLKKKGKLRVKVKVVFTPTGGSPGTSTKTVTFKS